MDQRINNEKEKFVSFLEKNRVRFTPARKIVFEEVMKAHGHFAAEELVKQCKKHKRNVSRASVYRCLREMLEAGIIRQTAYGEKHAHFEHIYDEKPHHHARCIRCGDLLEIPDLDEEKLYASILKKKNFKVIGHEMVFYGLCDRCQDD